MKHTGFTLVEVVVALGIVAGAMVLLISANHEAMRRSMRAHEQAQLEEAIESKVGELRAGVETRSSGEFPALPGWLWTTTRERAQIEGLTTVDQITLSVTAREKPSDTARIIVILKFAAKGPEK